MSASTRSDGYEEERLALIRQGIETALRPWQYSNNRSYLYQGNFRENYFVPDYAGAVGALGT